MNNGITDTTSTSSRSARSSHTPGDDELSKAKRELLQAEVRLAKARATVVAAEIDIKVATARLKSLAK
jgi:hypothetical protein